MKVLTSQQMRAIDKKAIEDLGIIGPILMENAGLSIFEEIMEKFPEIEQERVLIIAGKGNNGGDGFVVGRHLFNLGCLPRVLLLGARKDLKGDAALNMGIADKIGVEIIEVLSEEQWKEQRSDLLHATVLIDAIFGTGLTKSASGFYGEVIEDINLSPAFIVAVDIPSGLSADNHKIIGPCVEADLTVTLAAPKIAHIFPPAEDYVGDLVVGDIGIPPWLFESEDLKLEWVEEHMISNIFLPRMNESHKGTYGHLLICSGSRGKSGAAVLAGEAALKTGAGLVTIATPAGCLPIIAGSLPDLMTEPLSETTEGKIDRNAIEKILSLLENKDLLLLGPGIGSEESTSDLVFQLLPSLKVPVVLDADALNIISSDPDILKTLKQPTVLTPHPGEFARLLNVTTKEVLENRLKLAPEFAEKYGVYLILKGYRTLICTPEGKTYVNPTGNPGMATGGSGDVLSGMIASLCMQAEDKLEAILAAVYVHGLSGDKGADMLGEISLTAGDMIEFIPDAIEEIIEE